MKDQARRIDLAKRRQRRLDDALKLEVQRAMADHDVTRCEAHLDRLDPNWREHPDPVQRAMVNLVFNLGARGWQRFTNTRAALARKDYAAAARGLAVSKWASQVQSSRRDRIIGQFMAAAK